MNTYCIFCTQGEMSLLDVKKECLQEKWFPILVMRVKNEEFPIIPVFRNESVAFRFIKRNIPKKWICGVLNLNMRDAEWMDQKGWKSIVFDFARNLKDIVEFDVEILEYDKNHEVELRKKLS